MLSEDITHFDHQFFSITPDQAAAIDPQQRLLLEVTYEALESMGCPMEQLHGSDTAVFVGMMNNDYLVQQALDVDFSPKYNATGVANSNASSRISYFFDWHGPSMAIRSGTSNMLSPTGKSRMWDANADGYARGEGVASVVLKTLSDAIRDGDNIHTVIREIGVNHDGRTAGLTMPSATAQAHLIRRVYRQAGLDPQDRNDRCQFFEAHGTGTPAGDPQEAEALNRAFFDNMNSADDDILFVGSIKTIVGHTESTAGLAGLLRACLALKNGVIPPNLLFNRLNPAVAPFTAHLRIPTTAQPWPSHQGSVRRASVNSFGFGGANAHVILESYDPTDHFVNGNGIPSPALEPTRSETIRTKSAGPGAMMAVGTSFEDAQELCHLEDFAGTLCVAAHNSPESVTLSGDSSTIERARLVFEEEGKFARPLKIYQNILGTTIDGYGVKHGRTNMSVHMSCLIMTSSDESPQTALQTNGGYISLAMESAMQIAGSSPVQLIELLDLDIAKAIVISETAPTELVIYLNRITRNDIQEVTAEFSVYSAVATKDSAGLTLNCRSDLRITLETKAARTAAPLPPRKIHSVNMSEVDVERFYTSLRDDAGYTYEAPFRNITQLSPGDIDLYSSSEYENKMMHYGDDADFNITRAVGEHLPLPEVMSGEVNILEYMAQNDYLGRYYREAAGFESLNDSVGGLVAQITNKYPHMNFCEVGAGTGGATKPSWTLKMIYKTLNIEHDPVDQGFVPQAYDCVVAANVLHATKSLETTLRNVRSLLKPGGYLILFEIIGNNVMRIPMVMGGLPGWWIGHEDGRKYAPTIELEEWDTILRQTGFSGVDTHTPMKDKVSLPGAIFCSMALDENIDALRNPLVKNIDQSANDCLVILQGKTDISEQLLGMLELHFTKVVVAENLDSLPEIPAHAHILSLQDYGDSIFENLTELRWANLQRLLESPRTVLWVTSGAHCSNPYAAMSIGLFRSLYHELMGCLVQTLDCEVVHKASDLHTIAELVLRLRKLASLSQRDEDAEILWTVEPELRLRDGRLEVQRVRSAWERNDRLNSCRRPIFQGQDARIAFLDLRFNGVRHVLEETQSPKPLADGEFISVRVTTSFLLAIKTPMGHAFICLGFNQDSGEKVLCLSETNSSRLIIHKSWTRNVSVDVIDRQYLSLVIGALVNQQLVDALPPSGALLAYDPDPGLASLLSKQMSIQNRIVLFVTSRPRMQHHRGNSVTDLLHRVTEFAESQLNGVPDGVALETMPLRDIVLTTEPFEGAEVKYFQNDVADFTSVENTLEQITGSMPPLGGVALGALVLCDRMFAQMKLDEFQRVMDPKVQGTLNFSRLFSLESSLPPLDWFIGFSSIVATMGNPGQANYSAANCFIKAVINQRRAQGLAGSVIDISRVIGVGYVEREMKSDGRLTREQKERLFTGSMTLPMSETDLHQLFAEAIVSGRPAAGDNGNHDIITGMAPVRKENAHDKSWPNNPKFGLLVKVGEESAAELSEQASNRIPIKKLLAEAGSRDEMDKILKDALISKLRAVLFLSGSDVSVEDVPLIDIGVDSLVGVEIRAWCLKQFDVDVPVIKILGGISLSGIVEQFNKFKSANNCQAPIDITGKFPYGLDRINRIRNSRKSGEDILDDILGGEFKNASTFQMTMVEGSCVLTTTEPANLQAMLATQPQFARDNINDLDETERASDLFVKTIGAAGSDGWTSAVDLQPAVFNFTLDTATSFLFGESVESQSAYIHAKNSNLGGTKDATAAQEATSANFLDAFATASDYTIYRLRLQSLYWLADGFKFRRAAKTLHAFTSRFVRRALAATADSKDESSKTANVSTNLLHALSTKTRDAEELRAQATAVLFAGRDTTAALICWCLLRLAQHPNLYAELRETVLTTFPRGEPTGLAQLKSCRILQHFINEVLRLHPAIPFNTRVANKHAILPRGGGPKQDAPIAVYKGQTIAFSMYHMHRRVDLWGKDAAEFKPERWKQKSPPGSFCPLAEALEFALDSNTR
ncbi:unnamed protein product [Parascedosporium putredinis]|uniref:Polyketide synthase n=1 Tax=Parascedosporium putredinis TaxID=1442378 RepID=A0A9P1MBQ0_9PEZI|nr:unnamed protein product [Parascedosporium putredinis]CAI7996665.1 unnamed protein product [Parascedosporium putredinis]